MFKLSLRPSSSMLD